MSKNDNNPSGVPGQTPASGAKGLSPLFGVHCSTESFEFRFDKKSIPCHIHYEAHVTDPVTKKWRVNSVAYVTKNGLTEVHVRMMKDNATFDQALRLLADFENNARRETEKYSPALPDKNMMGMLHFKAFAEREGYVFDIAGIPHARPNSVSLPVDAAFSPADIASAKKNLERQDADFVETSTAHKLPSNHFLFDHFNRAAQGDSYQATINGHRALELVDDMLAHVETAQAKLEEYCRVYAACDKGNLVGVALMEIEKAELSLQQAKKYGVPAAELGHFLRQCTITCHVIHAQALYDIMRKGLGDFDPYEAWMKQSVTKAVDAFKLIDSSEKAVETLQNMIVQSPPSVPPAIGQFIANYKKQRAAFAEKKTPPPDGARGSPNI